MNISSILIIDDCDNFRLTATSILLDAGYVVEAASCPHEAFPLLEKENFDLILCDLHMPFINGEANKDYQTSYQVGIMTINELQRAFPDKPIIALTSTAQEDLFRISKSLQGIKTYTKPYSKRALFNIIENITQSRTEQLDLQ